MSGWLRLRQIALVASKLEPVAEALTGPWEPAGKDWQCDDPPTVATRWAEIAEIDLTEEGGQPTLALENAAVRFVPCTDGRPEGLGGIDVACADKAAVLAAAERRGAVTGADQVTLCGTRIRLR